MQTKLLSVTELIIFISWVFVAANAAAILYKSSHKDQNLSILNVYKFILRVAEFYFLLNARKVKFLLNKGFASEILPLYKLPFYKNI